MLSNQTRFRKTEQDNIIVLLFNKLSTKLILQREKTVVVQWFARFQSNLGNLHISQDICYVQMMDNNYDCLTI